MTNDELQELQNKYPSLDLTYKFAVDSYDLALKRFDAFDARIHGLLALATTLTIALPIAATSLGLNPRSAWFVLALGTFAVAVIVGTYGRLSGTVMMIDPATLYKKYITLTEPEFKRNFIYWSGENFSANKRQIETRFRIAVTVSALLFLEGVWVAAWVLLHS